MALRADTVAVRMAIARQAQGAPPLSEQIQGREAVAGVFAGHAAAACHLPLPEPEAGLDETTARRADRRAGPA